MRLVSGDEGTGKTDEWANTYVLQPAPHVRVGPLLGIASGLGQLGEEVAIPDAVGGDGRHDAGKSEDEVL